MKRLASLPTLAAALALSPLAATPALTEGAPVPRFEAGTGGITHSFTGEWEYMVGGGVAAFDCSDDGLPDLFLAGGSGPASLWRNLSEKGGALQFQRETSGAEVDAVTGAWPLDFDSDGHVDLAVMRQGENLLMRGLGDCRFERANEAWGFDGGQAWSSAFAATWERGQTLPTLAVGNYIDPLEEAFPWGSCTANWLHRPEGDRLAPPLVLSPSYCALSMLFTDWNHSGHAALRVSNDREYYKGGQEQLWHLEPGAPPRLYTEAEGWGRLRLWGMGIAAADLDHDGYPEYFLTSMADNKLQTLKAPTAAPLKPQYADVAFARGVHAQRPHTGGDVRPSTAWHPQFADVNNDGRLDLFIAKGNVSAMPDFAQQDPNNLLLQQEDGTFIEAAESAGVASMLTARGGALPDLNADGWLDLVVVNRNGPVEIWRNHGITGPDAGKTAHWLSVSPSQPAPNLHAVNGRLELRANGVTQSHEITVGGGHGSGQLGPIHFGLGTATEAEVRVIWPDGTAGAWQKLAADQAWHLPRDGAAEAR